MKQLYMSLMVPLPSDPFDEAEIMATLRTPWRTLVAAATETITEAPIQAKCERLEVRARTPRKPRKPRLVPVNPEAA